MKIEDALQSKDHADFIIKCMEPLIAQEAYKFSQTNLPCQILELNDYRQEACIAVFAAYKKLRRTGDKEKDKARFLSLCKLKIRSYLIVLQNNNTFPVSVSQKSASMGYKIWRIQKIDTKEIIKEFNVTPKIAEAVQKLVKSDFGSPMQKSETNFGWLLLKEACRLANCPGDFNIFKDKINSGSSLRSCLCNTKELKTYKESFKRVKEIIKEGYK